MEGKCRFWIVAACILQVLYGLAFMSMGVAASYLCRQSSCTWSTGVIAAGASNNILQSNWQSAKAPALALDAGTPPLSLKKIPDEGIWLAILYTLTGFSGIIAGQEKDRIFPLLHTILALICIIWTPLMWETLYLLVRPSSNFAYTFLNEMDLIRSQHHWAAYIISICVVVAGSALYLLSAALSAYQYGIRMISLKNKLNKSKEVHNKAGGGVSPMKKKTSNEKHCRQERLHQQSTPQKSIAPGRSIKTYDTPTTLQANNESSISGEATMPDTILNSPANANGSGSVNVDMDQSTSTALPPVADSSSSLSYQHHQRIRPNNIHSSVYHYFDQADDEFFPSRGGHRNRLQAKNESASGRDGNGLAFAPYYHDAQEAIV